MAKNYVSNKDETVRMFESDFMEFFSRVHYTVPLYVYVPVILVLMYLSIFVYNISSTKYFCSIYWRNCCLDLSRIFITQICFPL